MSSTDESRAAARDHLKSRLADLAIMNTLSDEWEDRPTDEDERILNDIGHPYEMGLDFRKYQTNHYEETVTWSWLLSTGGPHEEFLLTFGEYDRLERASFVYMDWGTRDEIRFEPHELSGDYIGAPLGEFVDRFLACFVEVV
jgi:hypothetical protein